VDLPQHPSIALISSEIIASLDPGMKTDLTLSITIDAESNFGKLVGDLFVKSNEVDLKIPFEFFIVSNHSSDLTVLVEVY
jgi:hypothetical protein